MNQASRTNTHSMFSKLLETAAKVYSKIHLKTIGQLKEIIKEIIKDSFFFQCISVYSNLYTIHVCAIKETLMFDASVSILVSHKGG